ncbi:polymerase delta-interacting protein 3 [Anabrus simplex]|uniref:polymerase delta-interacting protein 3 n=1 Tax=Anabrus simplex TaxID=316456 RepID=UPI0034DD27DF
MASTIDMSLDDIIQKKYSKLNIRGRGGTRRGRQQKRLETTRRGPTQNNANSKRAGRRGGGMGRGLNSGISDARLRIIQKNRQKLTDARDKLVEIAKKSDARLKLEKLRESRMQGNLGSKLPRTGMNITRRTGRNGQITLSTNKRPTISSERQVTSRLERTTTGRGLPIDLDLDDDPPSPDDLGDPILRQPTLLSSSVGSLRRTATQPTSLKIITHTLPSQKHLPTHLTDRDDWPFEDHGSIRGTALTHSRMDDSDEEERLRRIAPWRRGGLASSAGTLQLPGRMSSELKARLDTPPVAPRTMGILSAPTSSAAATPPAPTGHRIVVSNLQPSVTQEDIRELFEDIGPLVTSRLVRPGTAEVVYQLHKDAVQAVDVYHNRQLDGQPMKCMLVNSRPPTIPVTGRGIGSGLRSSSSATMKLPSGGKSSVVPDISTIHKALFNKS